MIGRTFNQAHLNASTSQYLKAASHALCIDTVGYGCSNVGADSLTATPLSFSTLLCCDRVTSGSPSASI